MSRQQHHHEGSETHKNAPCGTWTWLAIGAAVGAGAAAWLIQRRNSAAETDLSVADVLDRCDKAAKLLDTRLSSDGLALGV